MTGWQRFWRFRDARKFVASVNPMPILQVALPIISNPQLPNCPFYGYSAPMGLPVMIATRGNQCALVHDAHSPCYLETSGKAIEWRFCDRVSQFQGEGL